MRLLQPPGLHPSTSVPDTRLGLCPHRRAEIFSSGSAPLRPPPWNLTAEYRTPAKPRAPPHLEPPRSHRACVPPRCPASLPLRLSLPLSAGDSPRRGRALRCRGPVLGPHRPPGCVHL